MVTRVVRSILDKKLRLVIPADLAESAGLSSEQPVDIIVRDGRMEIRAMCNTLVDAQSLLRGNGA
jgi:bifunctional DNA-binding transcriptional regulator/antitoxin component of YhaV-PrlF toxin-antitoxin module